MAAARIGRDEQNIQGNYRGWMTTGENHVIRKLNCGGAAKMEKKAARETVEPKADERRKQECEPKSGGERQQPSSRLTLTESIF